MIVAFSGYLHLYLRGVHVSVRLSVVRPSACPSAFHFRMTNSVNIDGFLPSLVYALILWRYGLGLLIGKFRQCLTVICPPHNINRISARGSVPYMSLEFKFTVSEHTIDSVGTDFCPCHDIRNKRNSPASILRKSTSGRHRPVSYPDGPMTARYIFT